MYMYICIYMYVYMCVNIPIYIHIYIYIHISKEIPADDKERVFLCLCEKRACSRQRRHGDVCVRTWRRLKCRKGRGSRVRVCVV